MIYTLINIAHLTPIEANIEDYPIELHPFISGATLYDSSCSPNANVVFIDKDGGYFLKSAKKGALKREKTMMKFFNGKGLSSKVLAYISDECDWLLTEKTPGEDCTHVKYLEQPERLCDLLAERLYALHNDSFDGCPEMNHTKHYLETAAHNKRSGTFDKSNFPDSFGYKNAEDAWAVVTEYGHLLKTDTLLHGDYCLPNIILDDWKFSGFIDLDSSGVGDRHVDLFWGAWSLFWNLKTDKYRDRFFDAYGRSLIDEEMLRIVSAVEVFG